MFMIAIAWLVTVYSSYVLGKHLESGADYNYWLGGGSIVFLIIMGLGMIYKKVSKVPE